MIKYECWQCGKDVEYPDDYEPYFKVFCIDTDCKAKYEQAEKEELNEYLILKTKVMHRRALRTMANSLTFMYEYLDASRIVLKEALENFDLYQSSHEMICAMIFHENCYDFVAQKKIGKYSVDFYIPELRVVLEVDGYMHEYTKIQDSNRDLEIMAELGKGWEIVRIGTSCIEENPTKLIEAIEKIKKYRQQARASGQEYLLRRPEYKTKRVRYK